MVSARVAKQRACGPNGDPLVTLWALSRSGRMINVCSLFEHAQRAGSAASLHCFEALLMECERGEGYEHELALLKGLEGAAGIAERDVAAMCLVDANGVRLH